MGIYLSKDGGDTWAPVKIRDDNGSYSSAAVFNPTNSNIIYLAGVAANGTAVIYKSSNGGSTWAELTSPSTQSSVDQLAVDPSTPGILYAGCVWAGVFKSADGGSTWTHLALPGNVSSYYYTIAINPSGANEVFVGSDAGVYYSGDKGATWTDISADLPVKAAVNVLIDGPGRIVYVGTEGAGVCRRSF